MQQLEKVTIRHADLLLANWKRETIFPLSLIHSSSFGLHF